MRTAVLFAACAAAFCGSAMLPAQDSSARSTALAIEAKLRQLKDLPEASRERAIRDLAARIRRQPEAYAVALAHNLAIDATDLSTAGEVAATLAEALRKFPGKATDSDFRMLAEVSKYHHIEMTLDDPRYAAAVAMIEAEDRQRAAADFTLPDLRGRKWSLKGLRGKIVLVNFWRTDCGPCRAEFPDFRALYSRFSGQGLVILAITDEEAPKVEPFVSGQKASFPVLLDAGRKVTDLFQVTGTPRAFLYDREGRLVEQALDRLTGHEWLELLARVGLQ